jgi:hypothetical protein
MKLAMKKQNKEPKQLQTSIFQPAIDKLLPASILSLPFLKAVHPCLQRRNSDRDVFPIVA